MLLGDEGAERLGKARVAVFGLGGVGGHAVEALARAGVGALDLFDHDTVALPDLNRQIFALHSTLGQYKVDAAAARVADIHPACKVQTHRVFFLPALAKEYDFSRYSYVVDAIDTVAGKLAIIERAAASGVPVISAMGAGNKLDPAAFEVTDIYRTSVCPLARVLRRELKKRGIGSLKVVYSREEPYVPQDGYGAPAGTPGSVSFVPAVAGLILAGEVIKDLALRAGRESR